MIGAAEKKKSTKKTKKKTKQNKKTEQNKHPKQYCEYILLLPSLASRLVFNNNNVNDNKRGTQKTREQES